MVEGLKSLSVATACHRASLAEQPLSVVSRCSLGVLVDANLRTRNP